MSAPRFYVEPGSDQLYMDARPISHEDAAGLITAWRKKAAIYRQSRLPGMNSLRLARWCDTDADELHAALIEACRWRRAQRPLANVGAEAFRASVSLITEPNGAA